MKPLLFKNCENLRTYVGARFWLQVAFLLAAWWVCQSLVIATRFPLPGGVVGLLLLLTALLNKWISPTWVKGGAKYLIDHLALFFLPAMVAFISHPEFFGWLGVKFIVAVLVGTLAVMIGTAFAVDFGFLLVQKRRMMAIPAAELTTRRAPHQQLLAVYVNHSRQNLHAVSRWPSRASLETGLE